MHDPMYLLFHYLSCILASHLRLVQLFLESRTNGCVIAPTRVRKRAQQHHTEIGEVEGDGRASL